MPRIDRLLLAIVMSVLIPSSLLAQDFGERLRIYGFGGWAVGNSDPYPYLSGRGDGDNEYDRTTFVLGTAATVSERLEVFTQLLFESTDEDESAEVEIASAQWAVSDRTKLRFGRSRMPFGIYTEIFDAGTLRPFFDLPQAIYGDTGFVAEAYNGVGLISSVEGAGGWRLDYDLFLGGVKLQVDEPFEGLGEEGGEGGEGEEVLAAETDLEDLIGFRLGVSTPVTGLSFGLSAYGGKPRGARGETHGEGEGGGEEGEIGELSFDTSWGDVTSLGLHLEYLGGPWSVRVEGGRHETPEFNVESSYLEVARRLGEHWQVAGRIEGVDIVDFIERVPVGAESFFEHDELVAGLNYWFNSNLVLKLSIHQVDGNLFAHSNDRAERRAQVETGTLDDSVDLVTFGAQFSF